MNFETRRGSDRGKCSTRINDLVFTLIPEFVPWTVGRLFISHSSSSSRLFTGIRDNDVSFTSRGVLRARPSPFWSLLLRWWQVENSNNFRW